MPHRKGAGDVKATFLTYMELTAPTARRLAARQTHLHTENHTGKYFGDTPIPKIEPYKWKSRVLRPLYGPREVLRTLCILLVHLRNNPIGSMIIFKSLSPLSFSFFIYRWAEEPLQVQLDRMEWRFQCNFEANFCSTIQSSIAGWILRSQRATHYQNCKQSEEKETLPLTSVTFWSEERDTCIHFKEVSLMIS